MDKDESIRDEKLGRTIVYIGVVGIALIAAIIGLIVMGLVLLGIGSMPNGSTILSFIAMIATLVVISVMFKKKKWPKDREGWNTPSLFLQA